MSTSGNDTGAPPVGRRARNRAARHEQLMSAASEIVSTEGLDGLTMQAVADRVECAVGTIYTYFESKSSLLTALQIAAIETLGTSFRRSRALWDEDLAAADVDEGTRSLVRLVAFGHLFTDAPTLHPREFELLQVLLSTRRRETSDEDARRVLPYALGMINEFRLLIEAAVELGALAAEGGEDQPSDHSLSRTVRWAGALNGALLVSNVADVPPVDPPSGTDLVDVPFSTVGGELFDGRMLALRVGRDLLLGWGAPEHQLREAEDFVERLRREGRIAVSGNADDPEDAAADGAAGAEASADSVGAEGQAASAAPEAEPVES